jgi:hypothetical protein
LKEDVKISLKEDVKISLKEGVKISLKEDEASLVELQSNSTFSKKIKREAQTTGERYWRRPSSPDTYGLIWWRYVRARKNPSTSVKEKKRPTPPTALKPLLTASSKMGWQRGQLQVSFETQQVSS